MKLFDRQILSGHKDSVNCLTSLNYCLYSGSADKTVRIWDIRIMKVIKCLTNFGGEVDTLCINDDYNLYIGCCSDVLHFDLRNDSLIMKSPTAIIHS